MTEKRPNLNRKVTRTSEAKRESALEQGLRLTIDGQTYEVRLGDVTARIARELRAATGHGVNGLINAVAADPDVDLIAEFVWLARRIRGEHVDLDDVEVSYADMLADGFDVSLPGEAAEGDDGPEA